MPPERPKAVRGTTNSRYRYNALCRILPPTSRRLSPARQGHCKRGWPQFWPPFIPGSTARVPAPILQSLWLNLVGGVEQHMIRFQKTDFRFFQRHPLARNFQFIRRNGLHWQYHIKIGIVLHNHRSTVLWNAFNSFVGGTSGALPYYRRERRESPHRTGPDFPASCPYLPTPSRRSQSGGGWQECHRRRP